MSKCFLTSWQRIAVVILAALSPAAYSHNGAHVDSIVASFTHLVGGVDHLVFFVLVGVFVSLARLPVALRSSALVAALALALVHVGSTFATGLGVVAAASVLIGFGFAIGFAGSKLRARIAV